MFVEMRIKKKKKIAKVQKFLLFSSKWYGNVILSERERINFARKREFLQDCKKNRSLEKLFKKKYTET